jgi:hypothetical protein
MNVPLIVIIVISVVLILAALAIFVFLKGPDLSKYEVLREPRIGMKPDQHMLEVRFSGKPDEVLKEAFGLLFKTYYSLPGVPKGPGQSAPAARFEGLADLPRDAAERAKVIGRFTERDWKGAVALPIPESVKDLPALEAKPPYEVRIAVWLYGETAEILHKGSYESEPPTIARLEEFIKASGYENQGDHEEEYLKGPGMPFVQSKDYWTIIRLRVKRR